MEDTPALAEWIIEQTADAVIYADRSGAIVRWNRAAAALFGYSATETLGQNLDLIIPEHLRSAHWRGYEAAMASGCTRLHGRATLTRAINKTGHKLYVEMTFSIVSDPKGEVLGSVAVARDVTARVEREKSVARDGGEM
ncbi:sensory box histidine kinase/response regulator [Caballeronia choica]|jgi:PAS domain S-box-containing protein|uniref:Sensory box histidine kinase/response regulator n=1 Tax=Caballeronia choica TaxID=326476 RepID=A0A158KQ21_9BURK|nr:PAS domain S-box protein [Caballeronia choica]SAL83232.1 sensory box histidine kinase/response regulator [Caballeronia choica]